MTTKGLGSPIEMWWTARRSRGLLAAVHLPFLIVAPLVTALGYDGPAGPAWLVILLAVSIGAIQLRHSFATARGGKPRAWAATLLVLAVLVYLPIPWFSFDWAGMQWMFMASILMLLSGRLRLVLFIAPMLGTGVAATVASAQTGGTVSADFYFIPFWVVSLSGGAICIYAASRLVQAVDDLFVTRAELAEVTIERERMRVLRDAHDLLGQSLSAISLKGDLALALLPADKPAAAAEIRGLADIAREALGDIRRIVRADRPVSLRAEIDGATALLVAAGVNSSIDAALDDLEMPVDELFGWVAREEVTNLLRHSQASSCSIVAGRELGRLYLQITNDGARGSRGSGTGIAGLSDRAALLSGHLTAQRLSGGRFRLRVEVSETVQ